MKQGKVLVIGGSGKVGSGIAQILRAQNYEVVTATSRKAGAGQVHLNQVTGEGLHAAFEGVDRAFLLAPPGIVDQYALLSPLIQEAKRRGLKKVVLMTSMGANASDATPFRRAELELEKSGLAYNIIRPNWFMDNFHTFWIQGIKEAGTIFLPAGTAKTSFIDAGDISAVAAKLLTTDQWNDRDFDLTGGEALDHDQVARALSEASGREIKYQDISPEDFVQGLKGAGLPADYSEFLGMIMGYVKAGYSAAINDNVRTITGRAPRTLQDYAKANRAQFLKG
ncbi:MAG: NAD(P)H-binding protein [Bdellovibrionaceae bacterium]|nr:NAD(P)H-binding protein [Pseudobdellovibrionaceae bacterium]